MALQIPKGREFVTLIFLCEKVNEGRKERNKKLLFNIISWSHGVLKKWGAEIQWQHWFLNGSEGDGGALGIKLRGKGGKEKSKWFAEEGIEAEPLIFGRNYCLASTRCMHFFWWHGMEGNNMTPKMTSDTCWYVYRFPESGLCVHALARCMPHKCVCVLFWRELPLLMASIHLGLTIP